MKRPMAAKRPQIDTASAGAAHEVTASAVAARGHAAPSASPAPEVPAPDPAAAHNLTAPDAATAGVAAAAPSAVAAHQVTRVYGEGPAAVHALRGVSVELPHGQFSAVMGPSGSGKSTLLHILAGLDRPTQGRVYVDGADITRMDDKALTLLRRQKVGFVFQFFNLLPMLTAEQNITLPLQLARTKPDPAWVEEIVARVGLRARRHHRPAELSGGEQQRVAIARALVTRPAILFADEPTGNLDSRSGREVLELLRALVDEYGQTVLMVTHDPRGASVADRVLVLADGRLSRDLDPRT